MRVRFNRWVCETRYGWYDNGRTAIRLIDVTDNGPVATVTINVPEEPLEDDCIIIKDYSENIGMQLALIEAGVVEPDIRVIFVSDIQA